MNLKATLEKTKLKVLDLGSKVVRCFLRRFKRLVLNRRHLPEDVMSLYTVHLLVNMVLRFTPLSTFSPGSFYGILKSPPSPGYWFSFYSYGRGIFRLVLFLLLVRRGILV